MPTLFQAVSRTVLQPTLKNQANTFFGRPWPYFGREQNGLLRLCKDSTRLWGGVEQPKLPKRMRLSQKLSLQQLRQRKLSVIKAPRHTIEKKLPSSESERTTVKKPKFVNSYVRKSLPVKEPTLLSEEEPGPDADEQFKDDSCGWKLGTSLRVHDFKQTYLSHSEKGKFEVTKRKDFPLKRRSRLAANVPEVSPKKYTRGISMGGRIFARRAQSDITTSLTGIRPSEEKELLEDIAVDSELSSITDDTKALSTEVVLREAHHTINTQMQLSSDEKETQPFKPSKRKVCTSAGRRLRVSQKDAETQTICACRICEMSEKYKAEKPPPLVVEMANKQKMLEQRKYYMDNLRKGTIKSLDGEEKKTPTISKLTKSDYYSKPRNHGIYDANRKDKIVYLRDHKNIAEGYRDPITPCETHNRFEDYRAPNVSGIFALCYQALFEAEQRTKGIFSNVRQANSCCR